MGVLNRKIEPVAAVAVIGIIAGIFFVTLFGVIDDFQQFSEETQRRTLTEYRMRNFFQNP